MGPSSDCLHRCQRGRVAALALATLLGLAACGSPTGSTAANGGAAGHVINVVAGENVWGNIVGQIGGTDVKVTSLITDPNTDPHEYETDPDDAAAVARAQLVVENGAGYDDFLSKEVATAGGNKQVINVQRLNGVTGSDPNPHLWYSPTYVMATASAVESRLADDDPADAAGFAARLATFTRSYRPYLRTIAEIKTTYGGDAISYTERVPGYLIEAAGLHLGTPAAFSRAVEDGTDPTPADTATFDSDLRNHTVKVLLYNAQVVDAQTSQIKQTATAAGVPIVGVTETIPAGYSTFQAWQIAQAKALLAALGG
jgi:zinc/manganese transport system substrate-binding protein